MDIIMDDMLELKVQIGSIEYEDNLRGAINIEYEIERIWINDVEIEKEGELYKSLETFLYENSSFFERIKLNIQDEALNRGISLWESFRDRDR